MIVKKLAFSFNFTEVECRKFTAEKWPAVELQAHLLRLPRPWEKRWALTEISKNFVGREWNNIGFGLPAGNNGEIKEQQEGGLGLNDFLRSLNKVYGQTLTTISLHGPTRKCVGWLGSSTSKSSRQSQSTCRILQQQQQPQRHQQRAESPTF